MSKPSLDALFREQAGKQTDKWSSYPAVYEQVFSRHRDRAVRLLEIGVQNGGSLEVWARYFERAVRLVGCDIDPACRQLRYEDPRIAVVVGDAVTDAGQQQITAHSTRFDIVIDDGSHFSSDIIRAFCRYFPLLEPGGVYVVEDLHCSYWMEFEGGLRHPASAIAFFKALVDYLHRNHFGAAVAAEELLAPFLAQYGPLSLALDNLAAVEFFDSVCVVRKAEVPGEGVGRRVVRGGDSVVREGEATRDGEALAVPDQRANPFLRDPEPGHHDEQVQALRHRLAEAESETRRRIESCDRVLRLLSRSTAELDAASRDRDAALADLAAHREAVAQLRTSLSWRLTGPLRQAAALLARAPGALHFPASVLRFGGGARGSLALLGKVLREEGWTGVRWRLANAWQLSQLPVQGEGSEPGDYQLWLERYDTLDDAGRDALRAALAAFPRRPRLSVIMATYNTPLPLLDAAIRSVRDQLYPDWELCIADDASSDPAVRELLQRRAAEDERIRLTFRDRNGHISAASNSALALATGDFVVLLDHDDLLAETALYRVAEAINQHPDAQLVYSDEDKIDEAGRRYDPYFKSDFNPELMLAQNMISHLGVYRRELVQSLGGFREGYEGSQDYDLALRVLEQITPEQVIHIPRVLYHWRALAGSTALAAGEKPYAVDAARRAVASHLERLGVDALVTASPDVATMNRVRFRLPERAPLVSILIPTRDQAPVLERCVESIRRRSSWAHYEIVIIDNGSVEPETLRLLERLRGQGVRVLRDDSPFNFSALNNRAAAAATGDMLCLLNNDIEIVTPDWMEELLSFATRPGIGCVGARLWYPNGELQHGGIILGVGGVAGHAHKHLPRGHPGYFGRAALHQAVGAVTAACLMVRRETFLAVGGLDEELAVAFNDVDFCVRVRELGLRNVYTPHAECLHHESLSRGADDTPEKLERFHREVRLMQERWGELLFTDPTYSPNLTLDSYDFSLAWPPRRP